MKIVTTIVLSLSMLISAQAFELSTMTLSYFDGNGEAPRRTSTSCNVVADCYSYSYQGIGTDIFFSQRLDAENPLLLHGPWVGQDIGRARVGGDSMPYGATTLGYALIINQGRSRYYFGYGYGISYASLNSTKFGLRSKTNTASASFLGLEFSLFPYSRFVGLGLYLALKSSPDLPAVYAKDQTNNRQYYEKPISSSFGLILRF
ncbi:hypothetical protein ACLBKS_04560 [Hylemonella sp. W303a]|uniref:hypothetical protein n=1 Tax=Hylemonella sp. W303a TaxID=3389873 RepID=UPI00396B19E4